MSDPDSQGNVLVGDLIAEDVTGSYVGAGSRLVGVVGLSSHVVVEIADSVLEIADRYQVKHITMNPGAALSLQMYHHMAKHWIVVVGPARVTRDEDTFLLGENEPTYILVETRHRLENPGTIPLEVIEVQSGDYLGGDGYHAVREPVWSGGGELRSGPRFFLTDLGFARMFIL